jgi:hypothetical protein
MGNKRVSQLVSLTPSEVVNNDLFLIIDTSARESKKITISDISTYLNVSASITAYSSIFSDTSSYILGSDVDGSVESSSYSKTSSYAHFSERSIYSDTSSLSDTASYLLSNILEVETASFLKLLPGASNGTASYSLTSSFVNLSKTSSFLLYTPGLNNGTASYAITASYFSSSVGTITVNTAAYALNAGTAALANTSLESYFLLYTPGGNNGTASYAMQSANIASYLKDYGIYLAHTQSSIKAQLDSVNINPTSVVPQVTTVEAWGSVDVYYTSSIMTSGSLQLKAINLDSGEQYYFDSTPIIIDNRLSNYITGTITMPYSLAGQTTLSSSIYQIFVTGSGSDSMSLNSQRTTRFNINSYSDIVSISTNEPAQFLITPTESVVMTFTSTEGGPYNDYLPGILSTGSYKILSINANNQGVTSLKYLWTLNNLTNFDCNDNITLTSMPGLPSSIGYISCSNCGIGSISPMNNINYVSWFGCHGNALNSLPALPISLSHLICSNNNLTSIPSFPSGLRYFFADNNNITSLPDSYPDYMESMSFNNNYNLTNFSLSFPNTLSYFSCNNCPVEFFPSNIPFSMSKMYVSNCSLLGGTIDNICNKLSSSNQISGVLDITLNGSPSPTALGYISDMQTKLGWTVLYDS